MVGDCVERKMALPGGGALHLLASRDGLSAIEQRLDDGQIFRWLCSIDSSGKLLAETVIRCSAERTRSSRTRFDRELLMPRYHVAMVAGLGLHRGDLRHLLLIGVGGGALAMFLRHTYGSELNLTCVESSPAAIELGRDYFGLREDERLRLVVSDRFEQQTARTELFDAILVDTSESETGCRKGGLSAPHHALCRRRAIWSLLGQLAEGGVLVMNVLGDEPSVARLQQVVASAGDWEALSPLNTDEGNVVFAARFDGNSPPKMACQATDSVWRDSCESIGLDVRMVQQARTLP